MSVTRLTKPIIRAPLVDQYGNITDQWQRWFVLLVDVVNGRDVMGLESTKLELAELIANNTFDQDRDYGPEIQDALRHSLAEPAGKASGEGIGLENLLPVQPKGHSSIDPMIDFTPRSPVGHKHYHNDLKGSATGDDHTQYVLLAGRAGGQTVYGGNAALDELILRGSSHATHGYVVIRAEELVIKDGVNNAYAGFDCSAITPGNISVLAVQNKDGTIALVADVLALAGGTMTGELVLDRNLTNNAAPVEGITIDIDESATNTSNITGIDINVTGASGASSNLVKALSVDLSGATTSSNHVLYGRGGRVDVGREANSMTLHTRCFSSGATDRAEFRGYKTGGTEASPEALASGADIAIFSAYGQYDTTVNHVSEGAYILFEAGEAWDATNRGTQIKIASTKAANTSTTNRIIIDVDGNTKIGLPGGSDYTQISAAGFITLAGSAKGKLTMRPSLVAGRIGALAKPTPVEIGAHAGYSMPVWSSDDEELFFREYVAGRWDGASDITVSVICCLAGATSLGVGNEDVGDKFKFQLSWENKSTSSGAITTGTTDVLVETTLATGRVAPYSIYKVEFTIDWDGPTPDITASDHLAFRLRRVAASSLEVTGEIVVLDTIITYTVDKPFKAA